jgi:hypothetical protein
MADRCKRSRAETMIEGTIVAVSSDAHSQFSKPNRLSVELVAGVEVKGNAALWSVDVPAADTLTDLAKTLLNAGIELHFAELKDPVKDKLKRFGLFAIFGEDKFFQRLVQPSPYTLKITTYVGSTGKTKLNEKLHRPAANSRATDLSENIPILPVAS